MASNIMGSSIAGSHSRNELHFCHDSNEENGGDYNERQWHSSDRAFSSSGSVAGKDFEGGKEFNANTEWTEREEKWELNRENRGDAKVDKVGEDEYLLSEARQPLWRIVPIPSSLINPYRIVIVLRLIILIFFIHFRILTPVNDALALWLLSVICEIWFSLFWVLEQFPKWFPIIHETYLDRLSIRFEREGEPNLLAPVDVFVSTADPLKEPPITTANAVLSVLSVDYPVEKINCYVSDDSASLLLFDTLSETSEFARQWVPFCKKYNIEPRAPEFYFSQKVDPLKDMVQPTFVKERRSMKREYEEFKVKLNALVAKAQKKPQEGWIMQDGTPWPGNNTNDHPGMIQIYLGSAGALDVESEQLPRLVYVSREKRPGYQDHTKAGAMNALVRVSAVLTNAPFVMNIDCDHYINNSKAIREAMCFFMDSQLRKELGFVQFPQRFDGIVGNDRYATHDVVFYDINMKGLNGIQGPVYVGTGCVFNRQALYGYDLQVCNEGPRMTRGDSENSMSEKKSARGFFSGLHTSKKKKMEKGSRSKFDHQEIEEELEEYDDLEKSSLISDKSFVKQFGQSPLFIASTLMEDGGLLEGVNTQLLIKEAIHVINCGYEQKTKWGKEIGWIYGSVTEDILTGFKMHCRGWKSIYCMPKRAAFKGYAPRNLADRLHQLLKRALGSTEILLSGNCPLWYGYSGNLKWLERLAYTNTIISPFTSIPLVAYCAIPAVCLLTGKFIIPIVSNVASILLMALLISIILTSILELRWSGVGIQDWWRYEQIWVIGGVSSHLFAVFLGLIKLVAGLDSNQAIMANAADNNELGQFKWTTILIPPTTLVILNIVGIVAGISDAINNGYASWGPFFGKLFLAIWVIMHLHPFLKGLMEKGKQNRTPTIIVLWSILLASVFSLIWIRIDPFLPKQIGPILKQCGVQC
ncbi:hypothetical protein L6164_034366 [Bauhinia variegata]|uniref:Uncharacterized protein n=1 Tax=Bauhinia variegata TaxID=167791 RepID=A0ACB9KUS6_BAUVA|nr:hypothetical protein L6164_034366 [Bauhinia variegata]